MRIAIKKITITLALCFITAGLIMTIIALCTVGKYVTAVNHSRSTYEYFSSVLLSQDAGRIEKVEFSKYSSVISVLTDQHEVEDFLHLVVNRKEMSSDKPVDNFGETVLCEVYMYDHDSITLHISYHNRLMNEVYIHLSSGSDTRTGTYISAYVAGNIPALDKLLKIK